MKNLFRQGTFNVYEKLESVLAFVRENLGSHEGEEAQRPFALTNPFGQKLSEGCEECGSTLLDLKLVPAVILNFAWNKPCPSGVEEVFLKPEVVALMHEM